MSPQVKFRIYYTLSVLALGALAGLLLGTWLHRPAEPTLAHVAHQPEQRQPDGSLLLERRTVLEARPAQQVPAGGVVTGVARVTVRPKPVLSAGTKDAGQVQACECGPLNLDLTMVRTDAGPGLLASSPNGEVTGGVYQPVIGEMVRLERRHALGLTWRRDGATGDDVGGVVYQYDWGRLRMGATLEYQDQHGAQPGAQIIYRLN